MRSSHLFAILGATLLGVSSVVFYRHHKMHQKISKTAHAMSVIARHIKAARLAKVPLPVVTSPLQDEAFWKALSSFHALPPCPFSDTDFILAPKDPLGNKGPFLTLGYRMDDRVPFPFLSGKKARSLASKIGPRVKVLYFDTKGNWSEQDHDRFATVFVPLEEEIF